MGYNGSENFARGHRFGFFPAGAIGWLVSNEKWFEPVTKVVDVLKLKASYGLVGMMISAGSAVGYTNRLLSMVAAGIMVKVAIREDRVL